VARTGRPLIMSTGMATLAEIEEAVQTARSAGAQQLVLLKCTSGYPAEPEEMNLRTIPHLAQAFGVVAGLSDHTLGGAVPVAAVTLGASVIEKHFTLDRNLEGNDHKVSLLPDEFARMVAEIRDVDASLGSDAERSLTQGELMNRVTLAKSLVAVRDLRSGEVVGADAAIEWDASKPDGTPRKLLDVGRLRSLGWRPTPGWSSRRTRGATR
jgi:pseudaminic acid synthase